MPQDTHHLPASVRRKLERDRDDLQRIAERRCWAEGEREASAAREERAGARYKELAASMAASASAVPKGRSVEPLSGRPTEVNVEEIGSEKGAYSDRLVALSEADMCFKSALRDSARTVERSFAFSRDRINESVAELAHTETLLAIQDEEIRALKAMQAL